MTLLAPLFFQLALLAAAITIGLHFIVTRQPPSSELPTARFVPRDTVQVTTISRPRDWLLLLLRVSLILLVGLAFARPVLVGERSPVARIVLADVSHAVADMNELRDSVRALLREQDVLVTFAADARVTPAAMLDTMSTASARANLSGALVAARRVAAELRARADSLEIVLVSPLRADAVDAATMAVRELWPGPIRLVDVAARPDSAQAKAVYVRADDDDDGVRITLGGSPNEAGTRVVRGAITAEDSAWAAQGNTLVHWPADSAAGPAGFTRRATPDTAGAVTVQNTALVYPLVRAWTATDSTARVAARWIDGEPAALEWSLGDGCIRTVAVPVPRRGDLVLRPSFARFAHALAAPCAHEADRGGGRVPARGHPGAAAL